MIFGLFRRSANETVIDRLYLSIVAASRATSLYADHAIPDTFEGRFESLTVHAVMVLRRLKACDRPGPDMAQHLTDTIFKHFDRTLREMGVGDTSVPKRMKTLAEAFLGRSAAYDAALRAGPDALEAVIARNLLSAGGDAKGLADYILRSDRLLEAQPLQAFVDGRIAFADPQPVTSS